MRTRRIDKRVNFEMAPKIEFVSIKGWMRVPGRLLCRRLRVSKNTNLAGSHIG
jgi:hypothetical protein